jgi:cytoskeletal protein RodZ
MSVHGSGMMFTEEQFRQLGEELKQARMARARSIDDIASQTKIHRRHLESIE